MNQLINVAVAEKLSGLRTEESFAERAALGNLRKALQVLKRAGKGNLPVAGDSEAKMWSAFALERRTASASARQTSLVNETRWLAETKLAMGERSLVEAAAT